MPDAPHSRSALTTPLTERFQLSAPIVAGGLQWLANADYVAACARAGILAFITAASFPDLDDLRREIRRARDLAEGRPFGVNVSMLPKLVAGDRTVQTFEAILEEGVRVVETSGRNPETYVPMLKDAGCTLIHKVPTVRFAQKAEQIGADLVTIVGAECGGHPGMDLIGTFVQAATAAERLTIPYLIGGGVGSGSQLVAALAMGASGVVLGTRMLAAEELWPADAYKQAMINATERDTVLTMHSVRNTIRTLKNETTDIVQKIEAERAAVTIEDLLPYVSGKIGRAAYESGDVTRGMLSAGQALAFVKEIQPIQAIVDQIMAEATASLKRLEGLRSPL